MKKLNLTFVFCVTVFFLSAQDITITFQSKVDTVSIDSIRATNLRTNQTVKLLVSESLLLVKTPTGINPVLEIIETGYIYPNPSNEDANFCFSTNKSEEVEINMYNTNGQLLKQNRLFLEQGTHRFEVKFPVAGIYFLSVLKSEGTASFKAVSTGSKIQTGSIQYAGSEKLNSQKTFVNHLKSTTSDITLAYTDGDIIHYSFFSGVNTTIVTDIPTKSKTIDAEFVKCVDNDNKSYKTVKIGEQIWMAENLAYLPSVSPSSAESYTEPYYYVYDYQGTNVATAKQQTNYKTYGVLYNWPAAKAVCPPGWHVPSDDEWTTLENYLIANGFNYDGTTTDNKIAKSLTATTNWNKSSNTGAIGYNLSLNNSSGFSALPGGYRSYKGYFYYIGDGGHWWSSTEQSARDAWYLYLNYLASNVLWDGSTKEYGFSVRCIKDSETKSNFFNELTDDKGTCYFMIDTLDIGIKFQALDTLSNPIENINVKCHKLKDYVIIYVNESMPTPWFKIYTYDELNTLKNAEIVKSANQPGIAVVAIIGAGLVIWNVYDFVKEMVTDPPHIDEIQTDGNLVKKCIVGDWNDVISTVGAIGSVGKAFKVVRIFGAAAKVRGVTAINLGFTYKELTKDVAQEFIVEAISEYGPLDKDRTTICWYEQGSGGIENAIPIIYVEDNSTETSTFTDSRDGHVYKTIKIGEQVWMAENLAYLPSVSPSSSGSNTDPYYYVYDYQGTNVATAKEQANYTTYGVLYNWQAAIAACPSGWHLPSDSEWSTLENYLIANGYNNDGTSSGNKIAKSMAATTNWNPFSGIGTIGNNLSLNNKSGFSAIPYGHRNEGGDFDSIGNVGYYWSSTESSTINAGVRSLYYNQNNLYRFNTKKELGFSVRCVRD